MAGFSTSKVRRAIDDDTKVAPALLVMLRHHFRRAATKPTMGLRRQFLSLLSSVHRASHILDLISLRRIHWCRFMACCGPK